MVSSVYVSAWPGESTMTDADAMEAPATNDAPAKTCLKFMNFSLASVRTTFGLQQLWRTLESSPFGLPSPVPRYSLPIRHFPAWIRLTKQMRLA